MSLDDYDMDKLKNVALLIGVVIFIIIGIILFLHYEALEDYRPLCENNPRERYAQPCTTYDNCVSLCMKRLSSTPS